MTRWTPLLVGCLSCVVYAGRDTDEEFEGFMKKIRTTLRPMSNKEQQLNKMVEEKIIQFNEAVTESQSIEGEDPSWWNEYQMARYGEKSNIRNTETNSKTSSQVTTSTTWKPGPPVINVRLKTTPTINWVN